MKRKSKLIVFGITIVALISAGLLIWHVRRSEVNGAATPEEAVSRTLIAIRDNDSSTLEGMLYSKSAEHQVLSLMHVKSRPRRSAAIRWLIDTNAKYHQLGKMSSYDIRNAISRVPNAKRPLLESILSWGLYSQGSDWDPTKLNLVAVRYRLPTGKEMLSVTVMEGGKWKVSALPAFTTGILHYKTVMDSLDDDTTISAPGMKAIRP